MPSHDPELTLSSPLASLAQGAARLLGLTILWHPDRMRTGEQYIQPESHAAVAVNRFAPLFVRPGGPALPLGHRSIARDPLVLQLDPSGNLRIDVPASRMRVELDGQPLPASTPVASDRIDAGLVLRMGSEVILCIHWVDQLPSGPDNHRLLGVSSAAVRLRRMTQQAAGTDLPVLLLGETGTGKEVAAQSIHASGRRRDGPFVAVNMATLGESLAASELFGAAKGAYTGAANTRSGMFAQAEGGTLFLDEIGNAPAQIQPMLLRVLETGDYRPVGASSPVLSRARLIAATDQDLDAAGFNQPLLRRLEAFVIVLPPLRERREDIGLLIVHFMNGSGSDLPADFVNELCNYDWPGNIRQLANVVRRAIISVQAGEAPSSDALFRRRRNAPAPAEPPPEAPASGSAPDARRPRLSGLSADDVLKAMDRNGWLIRGAAQELGISRPSMYKLLQSHPAIRAAHDIPIDELRAALAVHGPDVSRCAALLRTPCEALRRHLRVQHLLA